MHKNIIVFLLFLPFIGLKAQNADIRKIYRYADRSEDTQKIKLPGGVMDLALLIMKKDLIEDMGKKSYKALKGINKLRIISSSNTDFIQHQKTERQLKNIRTLQGDFKNVLSEALDRRSEKEIIFFYNLCFKCNIRSGTIVRPL